MMKYLKVFTDFEDVLVALSDEEVGRLFRAMLAYVRRDEMPSNLSGGDKYLWGVAKQALDRERENFEAVSNARSEAGKKGGRPKATATKEKQMKAKESKKSNSIEDKDKDNDKDNDKKIIMASSLEIAIDEFRQYRKSIKKPLNELAEKKLRNELERLSEGNESVMVQIIDQSIRNGWQGVFPLSNQKARKQAVNYEQHPNTGLDHLLVNLDD